MPVTADHTFTDLVERYLGERLPKEMAASFSIGDLPLETQGFILRMLSLMKKAGYTATDFSPALIRWLSTTIPNMLPGAWGNRIPPITLPKRHKKLDEYVSALEQDRQDNDKIYIDVGCGFPPATTSETAKHLQNWQVFGVDRSFADYVLYDKDGNYACFDHHGEFQYFQAGIEFTGQRLYEDPKKTQDTFCTLFEQLIPLLQNEGGRNSQTVEKDGNRLIHNHFRDFETDNLTFVKSDVIDIDLPLATVIRCMNVLIYFSPDIRKNMLERMGHLLEDDGALIAGTNGLGVQSRYGVYRKQGDEMMPMEFSFSLDNLGPITFMPWFTIHENDPEAALLATLSKQIRSDRRFWQDFCRSVDTLHEELDVCRRGPDGYLQFHPQPRTTQEYLKRHHQLWSQMDEMGFCDKAVDVLKSSGYDSWKNPVGDITIKPTPDSLR